LRIFITFLFHLIIITFTCIYYFQERYNRWEDDVLVVYNKDDHEKVKGKSDDDDLFQFAKSQLLLLCVIIALFVVNVTTMPWTMLLGITFITPFVITAVSFLKFKLIKKLNNISYVTYIVNVSSIFILI